MQNVLEILHAAATQPMTQEEEAAAFFAKLTNEQKGNVLRAMFPGVAPEYREAWEAELRSRL